MQLFNELIFDESISGVGTTWYSLPAYNEVLGAADRLVIQAQVTDISGTNPTLTMRYQFSGDNLHWVNAQATAEVDAESISFSWVNFLPEKDGLSQVLMGHVRVAISLGGTDPAARLKIFACGRSL